MPNNARPIGVVVSMSGSVRDLMFTPRALFGIVAVFAQLRVDTIRDNTKRGLAHARAQGRVGGRPSVMPPERTDAALRMRAQGDSIAQIARVLGVGASSVSRALAKTQAPATI